MERDDQPEILGDRRDEPLPRMQAREEPKEEYGYPERDRDTRERDNPAAIRTEDTEPYVGLQYVARLFKVAAMVVLVALAANVFIGIWLEGFGVLFPLLYEVIRGVVLAAILWGAGDITVLLIDVGHDVRAARVLLGRLSARSRSEDGE